MKKLLIMMLFMNMVSQVTFGKVTLKNVSRFEINESIDEISNTAKVFIPRAYKKLNEKSILDNFAVGDKMVISSGYYKDSVTDLQPEFIGYIKEIGTESPIEIICEDESYLLRQKTWVKSYKNATLKQVLTDIVPAGIKVECGQMSLGRFQIANASAYDVLNQIKDDYGLYSRLVNGVLKVSLRDLISDKQMLTEHTYVLNPKTLEGNFIKKNELKFKRKTDFKLLVKVSSLSAKGKKVEVSEGSKDPQASTYSVTYPGNYTEAQLKVYAKSIYNKRCYDGYTGSLTGFGTPRTHAGDALIIKNFDEPELEGKYLIEKVDITYEESSGISRKNSLCYRLR